jgi:hypothetical protein
MSKNSRIVAHCCVLFAQRVIQSNIEELIMNITERVIIRQLIADLNQAGYQTAAVYDGGDYIMGRDGKTVAIDGDAAPSVIDRPLSVDEALEAIDSVDDATLHFTHKDSNTWGNRGVYLVLGNGEDVISDHHDPENEPFTQVICDLYKKIDNHQLG